MKKRNKKGIDVGTPMPKTEKGLLSMSKNMNQAYLNTVLKICLMLISVALVLMYVGAYFDNEAVTILGLGLGASGGIIQARINTEDE